MTGRKQEKALRLDMDFGEALQRFAQVDPDELPLNIKLRRSKKKAGGTSPPAWKVDAPSPKNRKGASKGSG